MLFNSYIFIFAFLPITLLGYYSLGKYATHRVSISWLVAASLFFYGWWNPAYLGLIIGSILFNYAFGVLLGSKKKKSKRLLAIGIGINLMLIGYYKYANFFVDNLSLLSGINLQIRTIILPLAISFFTFQQIAYLVDAYKGETKEYNFLHYCLFVTFFPQLIAGPIVHHKEMMVQFSANKKIKLGCQNFIIGLNIFTLGLFKKVILADGISVYATPVFNSASSGDTISFFVAWGGALAYTFQLYFDFSGYSDMAIGIGKMFGINLPINFSSPYKSLNIKDFWRRWHMTLSRFLRDYLYIPLGGGHKGNSRRFVNLMTTMLLGGLWHGAGWTFLLWGGLHGFYLILNHGWDYVKKQLRLEWLDSSVCWKSIAWLITFISVVNAWVFFRATSFQAAVSILKGMYGFNGVSLPNAIYVRLVNKFEFIEQLGIGAYLGGGTDFMFNYIWVVVLLIIATIMPNTQQIMNYAEDNTKVGKSTKIWMFSYSKFWAVMMAGALVLSIFSLSRVSEFLYFQF